MSVHMIAAFLLFAVSTFGAFLTTRTDPTATLSYGTFQGVTSGDVTYFLGMPYAQPPVGELRFAQPQPPLSFTGVQDATTFGAACPQQGLVLPEDLPLSASNFTTSSIISEDCLNINVITPASASAGDDLPVLFWIFGGAFEIGDAALYPGEVFVERSLVLDEPVVFVSFNYRLNAFGFIAGAEVQAANATNLGLRDQRLALEWVNQYISEFGGDPTKVIIWGESAGSFSVAAHLVWNEGNSNGLYRGAVMESGFPIPLRNESDGQPYYDQLVNYTGCSDSSDTLVCLRDVDYDTLIAAVGLLPSFFSYQSMNLVYEPMIDGDIILRGGVKYLELGLYEKVPVIVGDCYDEGTLFSFSNLNITTDDEFLEYIQSNYIWLATDNETAQVGEAYSSDPSDGAPYGTGDLYALTPEFKRLASFQGDWMFQAPRRYFLSVISQTQDTWGFLYERDSDLPLLGAFHSTDLLEFFFTIDYIGTDALINFANYLDPNSPGTLASDLSLLSYFTWNQWNASDPQLLTFIDPTPLVTFTADTYRADAMELLVDLTLQFP